MGSVLRSISSGRILNKAVAIILWVVMVITGLACLVGWIMAWAIIFRLRGSVILGGIIFQLFFVVMAYMLFHVFMIRAKDIWELPESEFVAVPIISILFRLIAELYASFVVPISIGGGIALWFDVDELSSLLRGTDELIPSFGSGTGFVGGVFLMVSGIISALFVLVFFYFLAEMVYVFIEIEKNTSHLRKGTILQQQNSEKCPKCGASIEKDASFCEECGAKLNNQEGNV
jgi:hypothetical protein